LLNAIDNWKENIDLYKKLGNSKLGILLYGQPGCGKSSMAFAIAQHLGYKRISMATLNLAGIFEFPEEDKSVVVFDDIDVLFSSDREKGPAQNDFEQKKAETLDDLMKFLDSDRCPESVVIFTTNYPERFDKALFRHGRINLRLELKPLPVENIISFTKKWYKIDSFPSSIEKIIHPMPFAHLSNIIRQNIGNFDSFCQELEETFKSEENS